MALTIRRCNRREIKGLASEHLTVCVTGAWRLDLSI
jgi:hypothetical protein